MNPTQAYPALSKHPHAFSYQGLTFSQHDFHCFLGLNAVDTLENVQSVMKTLQTLGLTCTRMGAYKPRTNPYTFQGHGKHCLAGVFELAGKHGIKIIAMEVTDIRHIDEIHQTLENLGHPTGVMFQTGTRNAQNFELLKALGQQSRYPILYKRGFGITLAESLQATEYIAASGNPNIVFCLRGVKSLAAFPHRNLVDFAQVPLIKRLINTPVCVDPSHAVGQHHPEDSDIFHAAAQGILAGANMVLADIHPHPQKALVDSNQAIQLKDVPWFIEDMKIARNAYLQRESLRQLWHEKHLEHP
jgi:3-deoxy-7-phosphoheptulonate synthase